MQSNLSMEVSPKEYGYPARCVQRVEEDAPESVLFQSAEREEYYCGDATVLLAEALALLEQVLDMAVELETEEGRALALRTSVLLRSLKLLQLDYKSATISMMQQSTEHSSDMSKEEKAAMDVYTSRALATVERSRVAYFGH